MRNCVTKVWFCDLSISSLENKNWEYFPNYSLRKLQFFSNQRSCSPIFFVKFFPRLLTNNVFVLTLIRALLQFYVASCQYPIHRSFCCTFSVDFLPEGWKFFSFHEWIWSNCLSKTTVFHSIAEISWERIWERGWSECDKLGAENIHAIRLPVWIEMK